MRRYFKLATVFLIQSLICSNILYAITCKPTNIGKGIICTQTSTNESIPLESTVRSITDNN